MVEVHKPGGMFRYAAPPPQSARSALANVLVDPSKLPDRPITIPGAKPPVSARPYKDRARKRSTSFGS